jgi:hypothetical protein
MEFTEKDIEKMAIMYIEEMKKEAGTYEGTSTLENAKAFQTFIINFGGPNNNKNYPNFLQVIITFMENETVSARSAYNKSIEEIQNIIVPETIKNCKESAINILINAGKQDKTQKVIEFIDSLQPTLQEEFNRIIVEEQQLQQPIQ